MGIFKSRKGKADAPQSPVQELGHSAHILPMHCDIAFHVKAGKRRHHYGRP